MAARAARPLKAAGAAQPADWLLFALLVALGGSSFAFIKMAVETVPPPVVATARLWIGAAFLYVVMRLAGRRFPKLVVRTPKGPRLHIAWAAMLAVSLIGYAIPFLIFPWAQQYVVSGLAGVYMAFMPIWTIALAFLFAGEKLNRWKLAGFALGFSGVMILMGPDVVSGAARSDVAAQAGLLLATVCYAVSVVISRRAPAIRPRVFACATVFGGAVLTTPALLFAELDPAQWSLKSLLSVVVLGVGPTGLAGLIIIILVKRVGAGFMSLANYLTPVWAVALGAAAFGERLAPTTFLALAAILAGVALSRRR
jgi:drug/metabolite transporter (DMT)-like permease